MADELRLWLRPAVERIEVAGSLRRGRPEVGDIELVAVPRFEADQTDLWGSPANALERRLDFSIERGWLAVAPDGKRGPRYSKLRHPDSGLQVDLFSVLPPECTRCGIIMHDEHRESLPDLRPAIRKSEAPGGAGLQQGMRRESQLAQPNGQRREGRSEPPIRELRTMRPGVSSPGLSSAQILRPQLRSEGAGEPTAPPEVDRVSSSGELEPRRGHGRGVPEALSSRTSAGIYEGAVSRAPAGHGAASRSLPGAIREGPSSERREGRQQNRESAARDARSAERHGDLSTLPAGVPGALTLPSCWACGANAWRAAQWGVIFLIRTGPASYSQWIVTEALRRGLHVREGALRSAPACPSRASSPDCACPIIETPEEADVYAALGLPYLAPERRDLA